MSDKDPSQEKQASFTFSLPPEVDRVAHAGAYAKVLAKTEGKSEKEAQNAARQAREDKRQEIFNPPEAIAVALQKALKPEEVTPEPDYEMTFPNKGNAALLASSLQRAFNEEQQLSSAPAIASTSLKSDVSDAVSIEMQSRNPKG